MKDGQESQASQTSRRDFVKWVAAGLGGSALLQQPGIAQGVNQPFVSQTPTLSRRTLSDADVGNLWPFVFKQASRKFFPYSYNRPQFQQLKEWKAAARGLLGRLLHYVPQPWPARAAVKERVDMGHYIRETVEFNTTPDIRVPAYVLVPKDAKTKQTPAVVALHDHGGFFLWGKEKLVADEDEHQVLTEFKQRYYEGTSFASELARKGYLVIVIDMFYFGGRRMILDDDPDDWWNRPKDIAADQINAFNLRSSQYEVLVGPTLLAAGMTWPGIMFWDDVRTVDYLITRPEVDRDRIGCVGFSVGGLRAAFLTAMDERIKATVIAGWMTSIPHQLQRHAKFTLGQTNLVPGLYKYMDYPDIAAMGMPGALLVHHGRDTSIFSSEGVTQSVEQLTASYKKAGMAERFVYREHDAGHTFSKAMQQESLLFLDQRLRV